MSGGNDDTAKAKGKLLCVSPLQDCILFDWMALAYLPTYLLLKRDKKSVDLLIQTYYNFHS